MIQEYSFGQMKINDQIYKGDLKIINGKVIPEWWQKERHKIQDIDLLDLPEDTEILVIGNGASGMNQVQKNTYRMAEEKNIEIHVEITDKAKDLFNEYEKQGKKVMGAFHLTC
ncbi:MTH938/NDUFAF3 family protein [Patescibacteria group bacterium]